MSQRFVEGVEEWAKHPQAIPRWRAFLEDLAAIGGHVEMTDPNEFSVCAPEEMADAAVGLIALWCGPGPCPISLLHHTQRTAVLRVLDDLPNLRVLPELEGYA